MTKKNVKNIIFVGSMFCALAVAMPTLAQSRQAWRCGNHFTNNPAEAKSMGNCVLLEDRLTIINGPSSSSGSRNSGSTPSRSAPQPSSSLPPRNVNAPMQIDASVQTSRDSTARQLIEAELSKKQSELAMLQSQYNNGFPPRLASEVGDDAAYEARANEMSRTIERKVAEIAQIQAELARLR